MEVKQHLKQDQSKAVWDLRSATTIIWFRMLMLEKRRRKKIPQSRNDMVEKIVENNKKWQGEKWDGIGHATPRNDTDRQNTRKKVELVWTCITNGKWTAASKSYALPCQWEKKSRKRKTTEKIDWQHKGWNGSKEHTPTRSSDYCVGCRQMEASSNSLIIIVKWCKREDDDSRAFILQVILPLIKPLIRSSSVSAISIKSSPYSNSHGKATMNSLDKASMTIINSNRFNAEPLCIPTFTSKQFIHFLHSFINLK